MEKINWRVLIGIVIISLLASCVPSLHSIVTEQNRFFDDRIIGEWSYPADTIESAHFSKNTGANEILSSKHGTWRFERAAKIVWQAESGGDNKHIDTYSVEDVPESMVMPIKGDSVRLISRELLPYYLARFENPDEEQDVFNIADDYRFMRMEMTQIGKDTYMDFSPNNTESIGLAFGEPFAYNYLSGHTFAKVEIKDEKMTIYPFDGEFIENLIKKRRVRLKHELIRDNQIVLTASTEELREFILKYAKNEALYDEPYILELQ